MEERELTEVFEVSRSAYHKHLQAQKKAPTLDFTLLLAEMKSINNDPKLKVYGSPRMAEERLQAS